MTGADGSYQIGGLATGEQQEKAVEDQCFTENYGRLRFTQAWVLEVFHLV